MSTFGEEMRDLAVELHSEEEFGIPATWVSITRALDVSGGKTTPTTVTRAVSIAPPGRVSEALIDGTTILATDLVTSMAAKGLGFTPTLNDRLRLVDDDGNTQEYTVSALGLDRLQPGPLSAAYTIRLRKLGGNP